MEQVLLVPELRVDQEIHLRQVLHKVMMVDHLNYLMDQQVLVVVEVEQQGLDQLVINQVDQEDQEVLVHQIQF